MKAIHQTGVHALIMNESEYALLKMQLFVAKLRWKKLGCIENEVQVAELLEKISKGEQ